MTAMSVTPFYTAIVLLGSFWGLFQSIIWALLAFIAIIWHAVANYDMTINLNTDSYETILNSYLYESLIKIRDTNSGIYVQPDLFFGAMIVYLLTHSMWGSSSVLLYFSIKRDFSLKARFYILTSWIITSCLILTLDVVLFALLVHDYKYCTDAYNDTLDSVLKLPYLFSITTYGIMMVVAARGFIIWIMNLIITAILIKCSINIKMSNKVASVQQTLYGTQPNIESRFNENVNGSNTNEPVRRRTQVLASTESLSPPSSTKATAPSPPSSTKATAPSPPSSTSATAPSPDSSFKLPRIVRNVSRIDDPNVETRLARYSITPIPPTVGGPT